MTFGPPDDPPLELAERPPPRKLREEPQPLHTYPYKRKLFVALKWIGAVVLIVGIAVFAKLYFAEREIYTFTDEHGVVHMVDELDKIPSQHRSRAKRMAQ